MKIDVTETKAEGLNVENRHLEIQLRETTEFKDLFERDNEKLREEYAQLLDKYNAVNQELSGTLLGLISICKFQANWFNPTSAARSNNMIKQALIKGC